MKIDGACHCGRITYEAIVDPALVGICHCTDCQTLSGSTFRVYVPAAKADFRILTGQPKAYVKTGSSGAKRVQAFCPDCGSPIYSAAPENPQNFSIRVGTVRQRHQLIPKSQIWRRSAQAWLTSLDTISSHAEQPLLRL